MAVKEFDLLRRRGVRELRFSYLGRMVQTNNQKGTLTDRHQWLCQCDEQTLYHRHKQADCTGIISTTSDGLVREGCLLCPTVGEGVGSPFRLLHPTATLCCLLVSSRHDGGDSGLLARMLPPVGR